MSQSITLPAMAEAPDNNGENLHQNCAVLEIPDSKISNASQRNEYEAFFAREEETNNWDDIPFPSEEKKDDDDGLREEEKAYKESFKTI